MKVTKFNQQFGGLALLLFLFTFSRVCHAQEAPFEIGDVSPTDFELYKQANDSSASAVVLSDFGMSYFTVSARGFELIYEHTIRIHILKKEAYKYADVEIPYFVGKTSDEREFVTQVKGYSHNLVDGKVATEKISKKKEMFTEDINETYKAIKFSIPNVKEGSIIEYTYRLSSPHFVNFQSWEFQKRIPVLRSEYYVSIPEFFNYLQLFQGYKDFAIREQDQGWLNTNSERFRTNTNRWVQENVPAFKDEKFITSPNDYVVKMNFQLASVSFPSQPIKEILGTWDSMIDSFLDEPTFGKALDKHRFAKDLIEGLTMGKESETEKMAAIYDFVRHEIEWDGKLTKYTKEQPKTVLDNKKGNSAEINVLLTTLLRGAGLSAEPVLISTRSHGKVNQIYPIRSKFNHVICKVVADGKQHLISATDPMRPYNLLSFEDLNGAGLVLTKVNAPQWVDLNKAARSSSATQLHLNLDEEGYLSGNIVFSQNGYDALVSRHYIEENGEKSFIEKLAKEIHKNEGILEYKLDEVAEENRVKGSIEIETDGFATIAGDRIYLNPMMGFALKSSPFKAEERLYPIDYGYGDRRMFSMVLEIPEGYTVEEMPKGTKVALPEKFGSFMYTASVLSGKLSINYRLNINAPVLPAALYPYLKAFYAQVVAKQAEQVVLKKVDTEADSNGK